MNSIILMNDAFRRDPFGCGGSSEEYDALSGADWAGWR